MREWLLILLPALVALAAGVLVLWRWSLAPARAARPSEVAASQPDVAGAGPARNVAVDPASATAAVPNSRILPHPEDMPLALLEFERPLSPVPVRRGEVVIGRHSTDDVQISDVRVSRHHARLVARSDGTFEIHNLTAARPSPNPLRINGVVLKRAIIDDGDVITLGGVSFTFRLARS